MATNPKKNIYLRTEEKKYEDHQIAKLTVRDRKSIRNEFIVNFSSCRVLLILN